MLVLKNKGTSLHRRSERSSLVRFLALYITLVMLLLLLLGMLHYKSQEELMFSNQRTLLASYANDQYKAIQELHKEYYPEERTYPRSSHFRSAIHDLSGIEVFSLMKHKPRHFGRDIYRIEDSIHFLKSLDENYYLGAKYLFIEVDEDFTWKDNVIQDIMIYGTLTLLVLAIFGFFFLSIFLRPMRDSITLLDDFIKDTTHELNTPISAILANVEMMDKSVMGQKNQRKLARINIAAKTVSHLYQDLTYLTLSHHRKSKDEWIDLKQLIQDRVEYFNILAGSKKITFELDLKESALFIDAVKIARVLDNLISNAIKYNKRHGTIYIVLRKQYLLVRDTGIGIESKQVNEIFERYTRFNASEGGFGIGLNIVKSIIIEYDLKINVESILDQGTTIRVDFLKGTLDGE
ncbi:MAG: Two-component system histidine kinase DccS [uncultured Sulfurovum sp.]|uniref:histidine kinase n=1 Tax=uncultured Sulfurovum sp. TaxID=269237 RepID=A0A6S6TM52_9BACT|nr:MAG: Two-component system histidine kinase DccS [uncultured Sulfurovum sp.]